MQELTLVLSRRTLLRILRVQLVGVDYKPTNCLCRIKDTACLVWYVRTTFLFLSLAIGSLTRSLSILYFDIAVDLN